MTTKKTAIMEPQDLLRRSNQRRDDYFKNSTTSRIHELEETVELLVERVSALELYSYEDK